LAAFAAGCIERIGARDVLDEPGAMGPCSHHFWRHIAGRAALVVRPGNTVEVAEVMNLAGRTAGSIDRHDVAARASIPELMRRPKRPSIP
jgi:hypothetical protein